MVTTRSTHVGELPVPVVEPTPPEAFPASEMPRPVGLRPAVRKPPKSRYLAVVLLPIAALAAVGLWSTAVDSWVDAKAESFYRYPAPADITLSLHPGTWTVYKEGSVGTIGSVTVTGPAGQPVTLANASGSSYDLGTGTNADPVVKFTVAPGAMGDYRIVVTGGGTTFAVGDFDIPDTIGANSGIEWPMLALLAVNVGVAIAIAIVPLVRYRRQVRSSGS